MSKNQRTETFAPYDSAEFITNVEEAEAYLEAAFEEAGDNPSFIAFALGVISRAGFAAELAKHLGMNQEQLSSPLSSATKPTFEDVVNVANALGLKLHFQPA
jgi:probable addiction module antidote protein